MIGFPPGMWINLNWSLSSIATAIAAVWEQSRNN